MKRIALLLIVLCIASVSAFAQVGDARTRGMAGAMTGLADDANAMAFNPAGIGFLKKSYVSVDTNLTFGMTKQVLFGREEYPYVDDWDWDGDGEYTYWDPFLNTQVFFDPGIYGFPYDPNAEFPALNTYENAVQDYRDFRQYYSTYEMFQNLYDIGAMPRISYVGKLFGVSTITNITADLLADAYRGEDTVYTLEMKQDRGLMGAVGLKLGIFGIGANVISPQSPGYQYSSKPSASERLDEHVLSHVANGNLLLPDLLIIAYGANDARGGTPVDLFCSELKDILRRVREKNQPLIVLLGSYYMTDFELGGPEWAHATLETYKQYDVAIKKLADKENCLFVNLLESYRQADWLVHHDGVHSNDLGHRIIANKVFEVLASNCSGLSLETKVLEQSIPPWRDESTLQAQEKST